MSHSVGDRGRFAQVRRAGHGLAVLAAAAMTSPTAAAQGGLRWTVDPATSLAWWQIDPHYEHLWATTCPADPSWQAGEGRTPGYYTDYSNRPQTLPSGRSDRRIPLFPRHRIRPVCQHAVRGEVTAGDTTAWHGAKGTIVVIADSLITGLDFRDQYARRSVLETQRYPMLKLTIDSLVGVQPGDTTHAVAVGRFEAHGYTLPVRVPVNAVRDAAGLRVRGQFSIDAQLLVHEFGMSKWALGMGVMFKRWKTLHMGVDLVLLPAT
jgi:polyisoprenoid-binding protein YceI